MDLKIVTTQMLGRYTSSLNDKLLTYILEFKMTMFEANNLELCKR